METMGFLEFLVYSVQRYRARVGRNAAVIIGAGECLMGYIEIIQVAGANPEPATRQAMVDRWNRFVALTRDWYFLLTPKVHLMFELNVRSSRFGSPWLY